MQYNQSIEVLAIEKNLGDIIIPFKLKLIEDDGSIIILRVKNITKLKKTQESGSDCLVFNCHCIFENNTNISDNEDNNLRLVRVKHERRNRKWTLLKS